MEIQNTETKMLILHDITRAIFATPRMQLSKNTTRYHMGAYHRDLKHTISSKRYLHADLELLNDLAVPRKKRSRHRPYLKQLAELLVTSIRLACLQLRLEFIHSNQGNIIKDRNQEFHLSKKETNKLLRECLVGLTGDANVLADFDRIKRHLVASRFGEIPTN